jgi:phage protein D
LSIANVDVSYYAPGFVIEINGRELSADVSKTILSLTVEQELADRERATPSNNFRFDVQDEIKDGRFEWLGHDLFKYGNNVSVSMGYTNNMQKMVEGKIQNISANFSQGVAPTFTVDGADSAYEFLMAQSAPKVFNEKKDSDIAREIAQMARLRAVVDETNQIFPAKTKQGGKSYSDFLTEMAASNSFEFYLSGRDLYFGKPKRDQAARVVLRWEKELISFNPTLETRQAITEVVVRGWDRVRREPIEVRVRAGEEERQEEGRQFSSQVAREIYGDVVKVITNRPVQSVEEARAIARSELEGRSDDFIKGTASTIGIPELKPGVCLRLEGLGKWFAGKYYIQKVTHTIDNSGYRSNFDVRRNAV